MVVLDDEVSCKKYGYGGRTDIRADGPYTVEDHHPPDFTHTSPSTPLRRDSLPVTFIYVHIQPPCHSVDFGGDDFYFLPLRRRRFGCRDKCGAVHHIRRLSRSYATAIDIDPKTHAPLRKEEEEEREQDRSNYEGFRSSAAYFGGETDFFQKQDTRR